MILQPTGHPTDDTLQQYQLGQLKDADRQEIDAHLDQCEDCCNKALEARPLYVMPRALPQVGQKVGDYELVQELGQGGMGVVYLARDTRLNRKVALKMINPIWGTDPRFRARFNQEGQALAKLDQHNNIVKVYNAGHYQGQPYLALEFVEGKNLRDRLKEWRARGEIQSPLVSVLLIEQVAWAIDYCHTNGVIHRDLKPANVIVSADGTPKITDFGLAYLLEESGLTQANDTFGTPGYMAPELLNGNRAGMRSPQVDVYALGAILWECLTGSPIPEGEINHLKGIPIPPDLVTICLTSVKQNPNERYKTAAAFANALQDWRKATQARAENVVTFHASRTTGLAKVRSSDGREGTCFFVHDGSFALTARSLLVRQDQPNSPFTVSGPDGKSWQTQLHQELPELGIAVLRLPAGEKGIALPLSEDNLRKGDDLQGHTSALDSWDCVVGDSVGAVGHRTLLFENGWPEVATGAPVFAKTGAEVRGIALSGTGGSLVTTVLASAEFHHLLDLTETDSQLCYVVLSEVEGTPECELCQRVAEVLERLDNLDNYTFRLQTVASTTAISSLTAFCAAVRQLCRAKIAIFDVTNFEPAVMLLLGIRAVVRRGVTVLSLGGSQSTNLIANLPFNIKDANIVFHSDVHLGSSRQFRVPEDMLYNRLITGLKQTTVGASDYLDLPVFDAVRNLPSDERGSISPATGVLVLASFGDLYLSRNWEKLWDGLHRQQRVIRKGEGSGIVRSIDLDSPRLVSHAIYSYIRRMELCVVDWTDWRPNVFFELGVRLAVGRGQTVSVIDQRHLELVEHLANQPHDCAKQLEALGLIKPEEKGAKEIVQRFETIPHQCRALVKLFSPLSYHPDSDVTQVSARIIDPYKPAKSQSHQKLQCRVAQIVPVIVRDYLDVEAEPVAVPLYRELFQAAVRFSKEKSKGLSAVLYPENARLKQLATAAVKDRLLAAWRALRDQYTLPELLDCISHDEILANDCGNIIDELSTYQPLPDDVQQEVPKVKKALNQAKRSYRS